MNGWMLEWRPKEDYAVQLTRGEYMAVEEEAGFVLPPRPHPTPSRVSEENGQNRVKGGRRRRPDQMNE